MARVSAPIVITAEEREQLMAMLAHVDDNIADRIRIVLACADEPSNKKVAALLNTDEHKVAKWKESFRSQGIKGLESAGGAGRKAKRNPSGWENAVLKLLEDQYQTWTIQALAEKLGVNDYQVSSFLRSQKISLERNRQWHYETLDSLSSADIEISGLYVSPDICAILVCYYPYGIRTAGGTFTTTNRVLADKLSHAEYKLSVGDVLAEIQYYQHTPVSTWDIESIICHWMERAHPETKGDSGNSFDMILSESEDGHGESVSTAHLTHALQYRLFFWSREPFKFRKMLSADVQLSCFQSLRELLCAWHSWAGGLTTAAHLYEIELLKGNIESYYDQVKPDMEHFFWSKAVLSVGTESEPISFLPWKETKAQVNIEDWTQQLMQGSLSESEIQAGFIAFTKDENGISIRTVANSTSMPKPNQFDFSTEEGFLQGMNQLEQVILRMRDEAGVAATDLYLEQIKKTKTCRNPEAIHH